MNRKTAIMLTVGAAFLLLLWYYSQINPANQLVKSTGYPIPGVGPSGTTLYPSPRYVPVGASSGGQGLAAIGNALSSFLGLAKSSLPPASSTKPTAGGVLTATGDQNTPALLQQGVVQNALSGPQPGLNVTPAQGGSPPQIAPVSGPVDFSFLDPTGSLTPGAPTVPDFTAQYNGTLDTRDTLGYDAGTGTLTDFGTSLTPFTTDNSAGASDAGLLV